MKFEDAFGLTMKSVPPTSIPRGNDEYPKILSFLWSMLAISKNVLDDIVYIDENKNIQSISVTDYNKRLAEIKKVEKELAVEKADLQKAQLEKETSNNEAAGNDKEIENPVDEGIEANGKPTTKKPKNN